jgi:hypothetical protein
MLSPRASVSGDSTMNPLKSGKLPDEISVIRQNGYTISGDAQKDSTRITEPSARRDLADSAARYFNQSLPEILKQKDLDLYQKTLKELSEAYTLKGDHAKAFDSYKEHVKYKDSLLNKENERKFSEKLKWKLMRKGQPIP